MSLFTLPAIGFLLISISTSTDRKWELGVKAAMTSEG